MAEIRLPCGQVVLVDDADVPLLAGYRWYLGSGGRYAEGRIVVNRKIIRRVFLHQLISGDKGVDHRNGNGLDNRRENLRRCTHQQNMCNRGPQSGRRFKGVFFDKARGKYYGQIQFAGSVSSSRRFSTDTEAALWYDKKARELHGEFAWLNFPEQAA